MLAGASEVYRNCKSPSVGRQATASRHIYIHIYIYRRRCQHAARDAVYTASRPPTFLCSRCACSLAEIKQSSLARRPAAPRMTALGLNSGQLESSRVYTIHAGSSLTSCVRGYWRRRRPRPEDLRGCVLEYRLRFLLEKLSVTCDVVASSSWEIVAAVVESFVSGRCCYVTSRTGMDC
jgi:hypothetical protein